MRVFVSLILFSVTNLDFSSSVIVGDKVLVRQDKINKLTTTFGATPFIVVNKSTNSLLLESPDGVQYSRSTTHVRKYLSDVDAASREETDSRDVQSLATDEGKESGDNEITKMHTNGEKRLSTPVRLSPLAESRAARPQRETRMPKKYEDFVT